MCAQANACAHPAIGLHLVLPQCVGEALDRATLLVLSVTGVVGAGMLLNLSTGACTNMLVHEHVHGNAIVTWDSMNRHSYNLRNQRVSMPPPSVYRASDRATN